MSDEDLSVEEMEAKLKELLQKKIDKAQADLDKEAEKQAKKELEEKQNKEREEMRQEIEEEYKKKYNLTKIPQDTQETGNGKQLGEFEEDFIKAHGLKGTSYEDTIKNMYYKGYRK